MQLSHGPLPPLCNPHIGPQGVQDPTHPEGGCHSNTDGCEFLAFLNFLYLFQTWLQTGHELALAHRPYSVTVSDVFNL